MAWPGGAVDTTDTDAGTDNPQNARADLLDALQKLNLIIAHVSAYAQSLIDDADASAALSTLGFSAYGKTLIDDADAATVRGTIGAMAKAGTTTNDDAAAGDVGEYTSATVVLGSAVSLTTGSRADITTLSLTAGDWEAGGVVAYSFGSTTNYTSAYAWSHDSASGTPTLSDGKTAAFGVASSPAGLVPGATGVLILPIPIHRYSLASTTTIYLGTNANFSVSTMSAYGTIWARRVR